MSYLSPFHVHAVATLRRLTRPSTAIPFSVATVPGACHAQVAQRRLMATSRDAPRPSEIVQGNPPSLVDTGAPPSTPVPKPEPPNKPVPIELKEEDLDEQFVRGGGNGGQKVNKTSNCVILTHRPTGFQVRCHETRSLSDNRRIARKLLKQKLDDHVNGPLSKRSLKEAEERRKKRARQKKSKKGPSAAGAKKKDEDVMDESR